LQSTAVILPTTSPTYAAKRTYIDKPSIFG